MITDLSLVKNQEARGFLEHFFVNRQINREFYEKIPVDKFDFRMVDSTTTKSDSPRESLIHQIYVTRKYLYGIKVGSLKFDGITDKKLFEPYQMSKEQLLLELDETGEEMIKMLSDDDITNKKVAVPWSKTPVSVVSCLSGLNNHEILHTGWNLAIMDHLGIVRFPLLKEMWG